MVRLLLALAAAISLQAAGSSDAADGKGPYFVELDAAPWMGAVRFVEAEPFVSGQTPEPTLNLLAVLTDRAEERPAHVAYFQLKQRIDCRSGAITIVSFTAWSADGSVVNEPVPLKYAGGPAIDAHWRHVCGPPSIPIPPPMVAKGTDAPSLANGVKGALEIAKRREADLDAISRLPEDGPYVAYNHPMSPREAALLLDVGHLARNGPALAASWLLLPPPTAHVPGYVRYAYAADCSKQTGARVVEGAYDDRGVLTRLYGPEPSAALASMGGFGRVLIDLCGLPPNPRFTATYPNVAAALEAGRAMLVRDLGPAPPALVSGSGSGPAPEPAPPRPAPAAAPQPTAPPRPLVLQNPDWEQLPNGDQLAALYPAAARAKGVGGAAKMRCVVMKDGRLTGCDIVSETPPDQGFGAATLATAQFFKMRPTTHDGQRVEGGTVFIPLKWALASD